MKPLLKRLLRSTQLAARRFIMMRPIEEEGFTGPHGCIRAASSFIAWNQVEGDYLEFGVFEGESFHTAYRSIWHHRRKHYSLGYDTPEYNVWKAATPRFFAFDCFEGLPHATEESPTVDYYGGAYRCTEETFCANIVRGGVDLKDLVIVKGLFDETCTDETKERHRLEKAALVMIDCDLYDSAASVMSFLTDIVQQGTILIFHDWFRFKGDPNSGEQRASREWLECNPQLELIEFWREGPQALAFLVNFK